MARMVLSAISRWPNLKIITHHLGAMVPFLEARVGLGLDQLGSREGAEESYSKIIEAMKKKGKRPVDYLRMFYADTAINGSASGTRLRSSTSSAQITCSFGTASPVRSGRRADVHPRHHQDAR